MTLINFFFPFYIRGIKFDYKFALVFQLINEQKLLTPKFDCI